MFDEKRFNLFWRKKAEEIRLIELDANQIDYLWSAFVEEVKHLQPHIKDKQSSLECIDDVKFSLQVAFSNYRKANKTFWGLVFGRFTGPALDGMSKVLTLK